jgi:hypothetical protein
VIPFPVDIKFVERCAEKLGVKLPPAYVERICAKNGGDVTADGTNTWTLVPIFDDSDRRRLKRTCNDVVHETEFARGFFGFPADGVVIANDGCGNHLTLLPKSGNSDELGDAVFDWDHETGQIKKVAKDFSELIELDDDNEVRTELGDTQ